MPNKEKKDSRSSAKSSKAEIDSLVKKIKMGCIDCDNIEMTAAEHAIRLGKYLRRLKRLVRQESGAVWEKYLSKTIPMLPLRTAQRFMRLSEIVDLKTYPALAYLGNVRLYELSTLLVKDETLEGLLEEAKIDLDVNIKKPKSVADLKAKVDALLVSHPKRKGSSGKQSSTKTKGRGGKDANPVKQFRTVVASFRKCIDSIFKVKDIYSLKNISIEQIKGIEEKLSKLRKLLIRSKKIRKGEK